MALLVPVAFAPDWIEWFFDPTGHRNREISHSLVSVGIGATIVALGYFLTTRSRIDAAVVWLIRRRWQACLAMPGLVGPIGDARPPAFPPAHPRNLPIH